MEIFTYMQIVDTLQPIRVLHALYKKRYLQIHMVEVFLVCQIMQIDRQIERQTDRNTPGIFISQETFFLSCITHLYNLNQNRNPKNPSFVVHIFISIQFTVYTTHTHLPPYIFISLYSAFHMLTYMANSIFFNHYDCCHLLADLWPYIPSIQIYLFLFFFFCYPL